MKKIFSIILLLFSALSTVGCGSSTPTPTPGYKDYLFFFSNRNGSAEIFSLSIDNSNLTKFVPEGIPAGGSVNIPVWSAVNKRFYTSVKIGLSSDIYSFDRNGKNTVNLTNTPDIFESSPLPSPDGKTILFESYITKPEIWVMDADGKNAKSLTTKYPESISPVWSADGRSIYFTSSIEGTPNIFRISREGDNLENISKGIGLDGAFSLFGDRLVFDSDRTGVMDIILVNLKNNEVTNLTNTEAREVEPKFSPDGKKVLYRSQAENGWDYFVIDLESNKQTRLTNTPDQTKSNAIWGADSKKIYFNAYEGQFLDIFSIDLDTGILSNITNNPSSDDFAPHYLQLPE